MTYPFELFDYRHREPITRSADKAIDESYLPSCSGDPPSLLVIDFELSQKIEIQKLYDSSIRRYSEARGLTRLTR